MTACCELHVPGDCCEPFDCGPCCAGCPDCPSLRRVERPAPPPLVIRAPDCPFCGNEVSSDGDGYTCESCECSWSFDGDGGAWIDEAAPQCGAVIDDDRCALTAGHDGPHRTIDGYAYG